MPVTHGRALVVGAPLRLKGVDHDVDGVAAMLTARRFAVDVCTGTRATRAGILAAYDALIDGVHCDEPAVFYFTGHGFRGVDQETGTSRDGIAPIDLEDGTEDDFHGITSWELSVKQMQLTRRTPNVTTILDCCFASQMSRALAVRGAAPRAVPHPVRRRFGEHIAALHALYGEVCDAVDLDGNPNAVRLVACGHNETAHELDDGGRPAGAFTAALLAVLRDVGDAHVSWAAIHGAIAGRVQHAFPGQRPTIEGPRDRRLFSLRRHRSDGALTVRRLESGAFELGVGQLMGAVPGDRYAVMPAGPPTYRAEDAIAELRVREAFATVSHAELIAARGPVALPDDAFAVLVDKIEVRRPVRVAAPAAAREAIERAIHATHRLRLAGDDEPTSLPALRIDADELHFEDDIGPLFAATAFPQGLLAALKNLDNFVEADTIRDLEGEHGVSAGDIAIEWGAVDRHGLREMPARGGALALRDRIYIRLKNHSSRPLYVYLFNLGLRGKISQLVDHAIALTPADPAYVFGQDFDGAITGRAISWPDGMPRQTYPRPDEIVVIVTSQPVELGGLNRPEHHPPAPVQRAAAPRFRALVTELAQRDARSAGGLAPVDHYLVKRLVYSLHPLETTIADTPFVIDDNPLRQRAMQVPAAWALTAPPAAPRLLSIRLAELVIEPTRLPAAEVRIDVLVCTRAAVGAPGWSTWTRRYTLAPDEPLRLRNCIVFRGPAVDFIDVHIWASGAAHEDPDLTQLISQSPSHADAAAELLLGPNPTPRIAAATASILLSRLAYDRLDIAGEPIGIARMSFVPEEDFARDREVRRQTYVRDVSITLVVEPLPP